MDMMTSKPAPTNDDDAPLDEAAELPAGAAPEALDAAAVDIGIEAELPAEAVAVGLAADDEPEPAEAAQEQTAAAAVCTVRPV